jgi:hypothetical protein
MPFPTPSSSAAGKHNTCDRGGPGSSDSFCFFLKWKFLPLLLGCLGLWQAVKASLVERLRFQTGVRPGGVLEADVVADGLPGLVGRDVGVQVD